MKLPQAKVVNLIFEPRPSTKIPPAASSRIWGFDSRSGYTAHVRHFPLAITTNDDMLSPSPSGLSQLIAVTLAGQASPVSMP